jgi:hypothetical protein
MHERTLVLVQRHQRQVLLQHLRQALQRHQRPARRRAALRIASLIGALALATFLRPASASTFELLNAGIQTRISETTFLGKDAPESFAEHDLTAIFRTPWEHAITPRLSFAVRLFASAGVLDGPDGMAAVATAIPLLAFGTPDGRFALDAGVGLGLLGEHEWGQQDFGGPAQFAITFGVQAPVYRRLGAGYRFMHYSDAGLYADDTVGADLHMGVLSWHFGAPAP